jgi:hypothetical protein
MPPRPDTDTDLDPNDDAQITRRITAILVGHALWPGGALRPPTLVVERGPIIGAWSREMRSERLPLGRLTLPDARITTIRDERQARALIAEGRQILTRDGATMTPAQRRQYRRALTTLARFVEPGQRGRRAPGRNPAWPVSGDPQRLIDVYERLAALLRRRDRACPLPDVWRASPERSFAGIQPVEIARTLIAWARDLTPTSGHNTIKVLIRQARPLSRRSS